MSCALTFVLQIYNYILGINKKYSKYVVLLGISLLTLWFMYAERADFSNYKNIYLLAMNNRFNIFSRTEFGFYIIFKILGTITGSFSASLLIINIICWLLRYLAIKELNTNYGILFFVYLLFPAFSDLFEIRFWIGSSIVIFAFSKLLHKRYISFIISILIATTIHVASIIYLPLIIVRKLKLSRRNTAFLLLITVAISFAIRQDFLLEQLYFMMPSKAYYIIEIARNAGMGFIGSWGIQLITFGGVYYLWKKAPKEKMTKIERNFINFVCKINMCMIVILILFMLNKLFYRIYKPIFFLDIVMLGFIIKYLSKKERTKVIVIFTGIAIINCVWHIPFNSVIYRIISSF